jgi:hypothetical protein
MTVLLAEVMLANIANRRLWARVTRNPESELDPTRCIGQILFGKGSKRTVCRWKRSVDDEKAACDTCISKRRSCMRLMVLDHQEPVVGWFPLPESMRTGVDQGSIAYYVKP